jgi:hypothetical protein
MYKKGNKREKKTRGESYNVLKKKIKTKISTSSVVKKKKKIILKKKKNM